MNRSPAICSNALANSIDNAGRRQIERLPITTIIPRAWIGFSQAPWRCVGLTALMLVILTGLGVTARDLQQSSHWWLATLGDALLVISIPAALMPLVALLHLADRLLPPGSSHEEVAAASSTRQLLWLFKQTAALTLLEGVILIGALNLIRVASAVVAGHSGVLSNLILVAGVAALAAWTLGQSLALPLLVHHGHRPLAGDGTQPQTGANQSTEGSGPAGVAAGDQFGRPDGCLSRPTSQSPHQRLVTDGQLPHSQTPWVRESRRNMLPT